VQGLAEDDYEVIVVNDGSTDNGPDIVEEYCRKYPQLKLVNQSKYNFGVGSVCNRGIEEAKGDYIYFVDADDWLCKGGMKLLRENYICDKSPDIVALKYACVDKYYCYESDTLTNDFVAKLSISQEYMHHNKYPNSYWKCIISRKVIMDNNIRLTENLAVTADSLFMLRLFATRDLIIMETNLNIYRYRIRPQSVMNSNSNDYNKLFIEHHIVAAEMEKEYNKRYSLPMEQKHLFASTQWYIMVKLLISTMSYEEMKKILSEATKRNIYPIKNPKLKYQRLINQLYQYPILVYLLSKPVHILYPFHKKYYNYRESRIPTLRELLSLFKKRN
jgi:glycosyltransferase involved in cell wall biosynthesis